MDFRGINQNKFNMKRMSKPWQNAVESLNAMLHARKVKANRVRRPKKKQPEAWKAARPLCGAQCRTGQPCRARVCVRPDGRAGKRCRMHGGLSTGPKSQRPLANDTPQNRAALLLAFSRGLTVESACKSAGISPNSFYRISNRDPSFARAVYEINPRW